MSAVLKARKIEDLTPHNIWGLGVVRGARWELADHRRRAERAGRERLLRLPGHMAYWFAWEGYLGAESELYGDGQ